MKSMKSPLLVWIAVFFLSFGFAIGSSAQTNISGAVGGNVTDPTGAAIPNATVTVTSVATGQVFTTHSDGAGHYNVPFLPPGDYRVNVSASGFSGYDARFHAAAGTTETADAHLSVGTTGVTVEVTAGGQLLHTEDAQVSTEFDLQAIQALPNPGNDMTFYAQTTPGVVMAVSSGGGYGNFATFGLPGTSNTFTINGGYNNDPFLNIGNTGATNLMLGGNDVGNVTVVSNAYDAAYGGLGGTQLSETTRAGENHFHGNANYYWNGRAMNANSWFNKQSEISNGDPNVPNFVNANQWGAAIGGPIWHDHTFFFANYEGIRLVFPTAPTAVYSPSPLLQSCALTGAAPAGSSGNCNFGGANPVGPVPASEMALYKTIFGIYNSAPGYSKATPVSGDPYAVTYSGTAPAQSNEWTAMGRIDQIIGSKDRFFAHYEQDKGFQPTFTSFISPQYNATSTQPNYNAQVGETHTFSPSLSNQFLMAGTYYQAIFTSANQATTNAQLPFVLVFVAGGGFNSLSANPGAGLLGGENYAFPQGRKIAGYQFQDDVSWVKGKHNLKFGFAFRRDDASDLNSSVRAVTPEAYSTEAQFAAGNATRWRQSYPVKTEYPVALYTLDFYAQDQWKPSPSWTMTYGVRIEHNANPVCQVNCFSVLSSNFFNLATTTNTSTPYNQLIQSGQHQAFPGLQAAEIEPRFGFSYLPFGPGSHTTVRGGFGLFADIFPATVTTSLLENAPGEIPFYLKSVTGPLNPSDPASPAAAVNASAAAFRAGFASGGSFKSLSATPGFAAPGFTNVQRGLRYPQYEEYSLQVEQQVSRSTVVSAMYVGNHGYHEPVQNEAVNAYGGVLNLPATAPVPSLGATTEIYSGASSNYNGLILSATHRQKYITAQFNYAYSHALDEISNGGFEPIGDDDAETPSDPRNLAANYGNADYDTRHYISANYVFTMPYWHGPKVLVAGWEIAGTFFHSTGQPFTYIDSQYGGTPNFANQVFAKQLSNHVPVHCGGPAATVTGCASANFFAPATAFGQQHRNQWFGPNYTDSDMDIAKVFTMPGWESAKLKLGAQIFNLFNHPNFAKPENDVEGGQGVTGVITSTVSTPTSIFGSFIGGDASPRIIQLKASFVF